MELGVRDWMIIIGLLLILVVLLDGYRRMRNERRGNIRMSLNKQFLNSASGADDYSSELPSGGARTVGRNSTATGSYSRNTEHRNPAPRYEEKDPLFDDGPAIGDGNLDQSQLDLDQAVPMLMESVTAALEDTRTVPAESTFTAEADSESVASHSPAQQLPAGSEHADKATEPSAPKPASAVTAEPAATPRKKAPSIDSSPQEVMIINVVARDKPFNGPDLLHILLACDLRYGDMNIFHRYEQANGSGPVQFSLANSVEPGTFDLENIEQFSTPGVCFFMSTPGPEQPIKAFEFMVETAQCVVSNLNGEMLDDSRSAMTNQTLEHCRQRLREFERRQLAVHE